MNFVPELLAKFGKLSLSYNSSVAEPASIRSDLRLVHGGFWSNALFGRLLAIHEQSLDGRAITHIGIRLLVVSRHIVDTARLVPKLPGSTLFCNLLLGGRRPDLHDGLRLLGMRATHVCATVV